MKLTQICTCFDMMVHVYWLGDRAEGMLHSRCSSNANLVHHEGCAARLLRVAYPHLPQSTELAKNIIHLLWRDVERQIAHIHYPADTKRGKQSLSNL